MELPSSKEVLEEIRKEMPTEMDKKINGAKQQENEGKEAELSNRSIKQDLGVRNTPNKTGNRLYDESVEIIQELVKKGLSHREIGGFVGHTKNYICMILKGRENFPKLTHNQVKLNRRLRKVRIGIQNKSKEDQYD